VEGTVSAPKKATADPAAAFDAHLLLALVHE
jgi:hypothetical protein